MSYKTVSLLFLIMLTLSLTLTSCIPETSVIITEGTDSSGFLMGIWHGWIAPVSLIAKIFNDSFTIYDSDNTGFWYDFGFYIAILGGFGGFSLVRRKSKSDKD
jgi:fructose-specific phosphotransferase system IIC component